MNRIESMGRAVLIYFLFFKGALRDSKQTCVCVYLLPPDFLPNTHLDEMKCRVKLLCELTGFRAGSLF